MSTQDPATVGTAAAILASGGVILYPTDTLYGLGADALSDKAVTKVYAIKGREAGKPVSCIVADLTMAEAYVEIPEPARALARRFLPGPLTMILKKKKSINTGIARDIDTIAIRIPDHSFCLTLARAYGKPITTTSANRSGEKSELSTDKILAQLGSVASTIDLVIDGGALPESSPSTIVDMSSGEMIIMRQGALRIPSAKS